MAQSPGSVITEINVDELEELSRAGGARVLDVREEWEFKRGHVPGAISLPLSQLPGRVSELALDKPYAVICEHGSRSLVGADLLLRGDLQGAVSVRGGTSAWVRSGRPLEKD